MSEFFDLDRPDGDDKHDAEFSRVPLLPRTQQTLDAIRVLDQISETLRAERRVELAGYPDGSE